jgi:trk system potassium uptake protein TrkH
MLRIGIICKAIKEDVKKIIMPGQAVIVERMHHIKEVFLEDKVVRSALIITLFYIILYGLGALIGMFFGNPFLESLFESTSAAANIGLSCGITKPSMPIALKITYVIQMWAGRLEFMSVFTIFGVLYATIKGK